MTFRCLKYRILDRAKQTRLASWLFYYGGKFQHFDKIALVGLVSRQENNEADGDRTFNVAIQSPAHLLVLSESWHCEVTPCADELLRAKVLTLKVGQRVRVSGTRTWDADHHIGPWKFGGGKWECHPVTDIVVLGE